MFPILAAALAPAWADTVDWVPVDDVTVGTPIGVTVLAVADDGTPITGLRLKVDASLGDLGDWTSPSPGVYVSTYLPPTVSGRTSVQITGRGRTPSRQEIAFSGSLDVVPSTRTTLSMTVNPEALVLGEPGNGTVTVAGARGTPLLDTNSGTIDTFTPLGGGRFTARYQPKAVNYPHVALLGAADPVTGDVAWAPIGLSGKAEFPVDVGGDATVMLRLGGREHGPVRSNADGVASVPIVVPPGVGTATKVVVRGSDVAESEIDLQIPATRRIAVLPTPARVIDGVPFDVYVAVTDPTGRPDPAATPTFTTNAGTFGPVRAVSAGLYAATWTPARPAQGASPQITASLGDERQTTEREVAVLPPLPASLEVVADAPPASGAMRVEAFVRDAQDVGLSGYRVTPTGAATARLEDLGGGHFRWSAELSPAARQQVVVAHGDPTGLPAAHLLVTAPTGAVAPEGAVPVAILAVDRFGAPVPGVTIELTVRGERGRVERTVTTGDNGVALARYRAGTDRGAARIDAVADGTHGSLVLAQVPGGGVTLPTPAPEPWAAAARASLKWIGDVAAVAEPSPPATPAPATPATPEPPAPSTPAPSEPEQPLGFLRFHVGYAPSWYRYKQDPASDPGQLLPQQVVVGGPDGDGPARPQGVEAGVRAFPDAVPWVGVDASVRFGAYGITAPQFGDKVAKDALQHYRIAAVGRLPIRLDAARGDGGQAHVGVRAGLDVSDFLYFTGDVDLGQVQYATLLVPAVSLGGEIAGEYGPVFGRFSADGLLAYASDPLGMRYQLDVGVQAGDAAFFQLGGGLANRRVTMVGSESGRELGDVTDRQLGLAFSVGWRP